MTTTPQPARNEDLVTALAAIEHIACGRSDEGASLLSDPACPGITGAAARLAADFALLLVNQDLNELHRRFDRVRLHILSGGVHE